MPTASTLTRALVATLASVALYLTGLAVQPDTAYAAIDPTSCTDMDAFCIGIDPNAEVGPGSCNAPGACALLTGTVGAGSCNGDGACYAAGDSGPSGSGSAAIGNGSCNGDNACYAAGTGGPDGSGFTTIGNGSCNGEAACYAAGSGGPESDGSAAIGNGSCNGEAACYAAGSGGPESDGSAVIGDWSCNGQDTCYAAGVGEGSEIGDCENNTVPVGCFVIVTKTADPDEIPETGDTPVTYTVTIEFLEDEDLNFIEDDQFTLVVATHCRLNGGGAPSLPGIFTAGDVIVCTYTYEPQPGEAGETHDNVVTVNIGHPACPDEEEPEGPTGPTGPTGAVGPADHDCEVQNQAISPGEVPGTFDVTAEASVLYLEAEEPEPDPDDDRSPIRPRPPNIGAGLGGLFAGQPTPLPTAPSAVAPSTTIRPPSTGDAGLLAGTGIVDRGFVIGAAAVLTFTGIAIARRRRA